MITSTLSPAQRQVLYELCYGNPNTGAIASKLHIQPCTVAMHISELNSIYYTKNRIQLIWKFHSEAKVLFMGESQDTIPPSREFEFCLAAPSQTRR